MRVFFFLADWSRLRSSWPRKSFDSWSADFPGFGSLEYFLPTDDRLALSRAGRSPSRRLFAEERILEFFESRS